MIITFKELYDFTASIEKHGIEVRGSWGEPPNHDTLMLRDKSTQTTKFSLNFEVPWDDVCPECGELEPWPGWHYPSLGNGRHVIPWDDVEMREHQPHTPEQRRYL
jgi:hypothetical protein